MVPGEAHQASITPQFPPSTVYNWQLRMSRLHDRLLPAEASTSAVNDTTSDSITVPAEVNKRDGRSTHPDTSTGTDRTVAVSPAFRGALIAGMLCAGTANTLLNKFAYETVATGSIVGPGACKRAWVPMWRFDT